MPFKRTVMNMLRSGLIVILMLSVDSSATSKAFEGQLYGEETIVLNGGIEYVVPECRKLLIKDLLKFSDDTWLQIDGTMEIYQYKLGVGAGKHIIEGTFQYRTESESPDDFVLLYPFTKVILFSKVGVEITDASLFKWVQLEKPECG